MNCTEFKTRLASAVERRQPLDSAAADDHWRRCNDAACRRQWQAALLLEQGIAAWRRLPPAINVTDGVVTEWRAGLETCSPPHVSPTGAGHVANGRAPIGARSRAATRSTNSAGAWSAIVVAAVLCVGTLALVSFVPNNSAPVAHTAPGPLPAGDGLAAGAGEFAVAASDPALEDMGRSYVGLMQNATFAVTDVVVLTLGGSEQIEEPTPAAHWVHRWRDELGPVRDDVDDAVEKFLKTFPDSFPST
jgi:hypothetical protein